jgi:hypothetical protein
MAKCVRCGSETELFDSGIPVCVQCANEREANSKNRKPERHVRTVLTEQLAEASDRAKEAAEAFAAVISAIPSATPHPDGAQRIQNASREVSISRAQMMTAQSRLNDYLSRGVVPDDLKQSR